MVLDQASIKPTPLSSGKFFADAYNFLGKPKTPAQTNADGAGDKPPAIDDPFAPKYNKLDKTKEVPAAKTEDLKFAGKPVPFERNGQKGTFYVDEKSGYISGIEFGEGPRKGQRCIFQRDQTSGRLTGMHFSMPGNDGKPGPWLDFQKGENGWASVPPGKLPPGFSQLKTEGGIISGDFQVNSQGDITYQTTDKQTRETIKVDGTHDCYDMRRYSRQTETADGQKSQTYWDGYEWRPGRLSPIAEGVYKISFDKQAGKPETVVRDANTNGFFVDFGAGGTQFDVKKWQDGKMTRTSAGKTDTIYNTYVPDKNGRLQWHKGSETTSNNKRIVQFEANENLKSSIQAGELPKTVEIDLTNGQGTLTFANKNTVVADGYGRQQKITYANNTSVEIVRDCNEEFRGLKRSDGSVIAMDGIVAGGKGDTPPLWLVKSPGREELRLQGSLTFGPAGAWTINGNGGDAVTYSGTGEMQCKAGGKTFNDPAQGTGGDGTSKDKGADKDKSKEPDKDKSKDDPKKPGPPKQDDKPPEKKPEEKEKKPESKIDDIKVEQLQALAKKYDVDPRILIQALVRAKKIGSRNFTLENLEKFLTLAKKHNLDKSFIMGGVSMRSRPGALVGRLIPELLDEPSTAIGKAQTEMKQSLEKAMKDGGAPPQAVSRAMASIDMRFGFYQSSLRPFIDDLKKEIVIKPPEPAPPPKPKPPGQT